MQLGAATRLNLLRLERHLKLLRRVFPKRSLGLAAIHKALGFVEVGVRFIRVLGAVVTPDEGMPVEILLVVKALRFLVSNCSIAFKHKIVDLIIYNFLLFVFIIYIKVIN